MNANTLFTKSLTQISNPSIRAWARTNQAVFCQIAAIWLRSHRADPEKTTKFATYIVAQAVGA